MADTLEQIEAKKKRVLRLLRHPKWAKRSTNWIAMQAGVSWLFVDKIRIELDPDPPAKRESRRGDFKPVSKN